MVGFLSHHHFCSPSWWEGVRRIRVPQNLKNFVGDNPPGGKGALAHCAKNYPILLPIPRRVLPGTPFRRKGESPIPHRVRGHPSENPPQNFSNFAGPDGGELLGFSLTIMFWLFSPSAPEKHTAFLGKFHLATK